MKTENYDIQVPDYLDREVIVDEILYAIVGAVYGDSSHFVFRYYYDDKFFEADGMQKHSTSSYNSVKRSAVSKVINEPYEKALAGHIDWNYDKNGVKTGGKKVADVYYMKC